MKKKLLAVALGVSMVFSTASAFACSAVYVGSDVSSDGTTIIARSEDQGNGAYNKEFIVVPRITKSGRSITDANGLKIPLAKTTYKYTSTPDPVGQGDGPYDEACTNEYGLTISATVSASPCEAFEKADPYAEPGLREAVLTGIVAGSCKTAKEGVEKLAALVDKYGSEEGNIIMLADQKEAWIMEIYSGTQWAAMKMPTDKVAMFGNQFMIGAVSEEQTSSFMYSKDLFTILDNADLTVNENGKVNLAKSICDNERSDYSNMRTWGGHTLLAPSTVNTEEYNNSTFYPLFYTPDNKISPLDAMDVLRYRYEGTQYDMEMKGNEDLRPMGTERQSSIHVIQVYKNNPKKMSAIQWLALGNSEHSVFIPAFSGISDTNKAYQRDTVDFDLNSAYWKFKRLCTMGEQDRSLYGDGVRDYWKFQEELMYDRMQKAQKGMLKRYYMNPKSAEEYVTKLGSSMAQSQMDAATKLYGDLAFEMSYNKGLSSSKTKHTFVADVKVNDVAKAMGYKAKWDKSKNNLVLTKGSNTVKFVMDENVIKTNIDGKTSTIELDSPMYKYNKTTYVSYNGVKDLI